MKIFVASSAELKNERMELVDLMLDLNDEQEGQGTKLKPVLWEFMDPSMGTKRKEDEYLKKLRECEVCLVLFWKELGKYTVEELDDAVKEMNAGRLPKKVVALFKEPADDIKPVLADFKRSFSLNYPSIPVRKFQDAMELRELATDIVKESASCLKSLQTHEETGAHSGMKEIKVMIAASEELHQEKMNFSGLIGNLNEVLAPRNVELKRVKWDPEVDGSLEDYKAKLHDCEMCLTLYWQDLAGNSQEELDKAYRNLRDNNNPRKLYVFFKEPSDGITKLLRDFKASFETKYGHFYCKFENPDTMNLQFILQFEAYQNDLQRDFVKVSKGKVMVGGKEMVDLKEVPFAALNKEFQRLQGELAKLDRLLDNAREKYKADPGNVDLEDEILSTKSRQNKLVEEIEKHQQHLYDIALHFSKLSGMRYSETLRKARELFEMGNNVEADEILNTEETKRERDYRLKIRSNLKQQTEQNDLDLEKIIIIFRTKAVTVMANMSISEDERFSSACEAFQEAIKTAKEIDYDPIKFSKILVDYAILLDKNNKKNEAIKYCEMALQIKRKWATDNPEAFQSGVARNLHFLAKLHMDINRPFKAEEEYKEMLNIERKMAEVMYDEDGFYSDLVAYTLNRLANVHENLNRPGEAEAEYKEALEKFKNSTNKIGIVETLENLANLHKSLNLFDKAEMEYKEALNFYKEFSWIYHPDIAHMADIHKNLALIYADINRFDEAEKECKKALKLYEELAKVYSETFLKDMAITINILAMIHKNLNRPDRAETEYKQALEIYKGLSIDNSDESKNEMADTLSNLAIFHSDINRLSDAEKEFKEALCIRQGLVEKNQIEFLVGLAMNFYNLAFLHEKLNRPFEAESEYKKALEILERLNNSTSAYKDCKAKILFSLALLHKNLNNYIEAEDEFSKALSIYREMVEYKPFVYTGCLAMTLYFQAILHVNLKHLFEAEAAYKEALEFGRKLANFKPDAFVAMILNNLALLHMSLNNFAEAELESSESLDIYRELERYSPGVYIGYVAMVDNNLAALHYNLNRPVEAEKEYKEALDIRRRLAKDNPDAYMGDVADTLNNLALLHYNLNRPSEAEKEYKEALEIWRGLAEDNTDAYSSCVAGTLNGLAYLYASQNDFSKAIEAIDEAITLMPENAEYCNAKGEILLMNNAEQDALMMWRKVMELDLDFLSKHNGETELHRQLKERGLIEK